MEVKQSIRTFTDHLGRAVELPYPPERVVSLCPSQTETLVDMGIRERLVGRTSFCIHPAEALEHVTVVGGTKTLKTERVLALEPDLVICEKEENTQEIVDALSAEVPVYVTDVRDWYDGIRMIRDLGALTGLENRSETLAAEVAEAFGQIEPLEKPLSAVYLIWNSPMMAVGSDTYINSVLDLCGFRNPCTRLKGRYPELTPGHLRQLQPDVVFLSTEPFHFTTEHVREFQHTMPHSKVVLVEGEMFTWYGSRMLQAKDYLNRLVQRLK